MATIWRALWRHRKAWLGPLLLIIVLFGAILLLSGPDIPGLFRYLEF
jgi:hypothetical protein